MNRFVYAQEIYAKCQEKVSAGEIVFINGCEESQNNEIIFKAKKSKHFEKILPKGIHTLTENSVGIVLACDAFEGIPQIGSVKKDFVSGEVFKVLTFEGV